MGIQSWSKSAVSAEQHPAALNPVVGPVPRLWHCAALLLVHCWQDWASLLSQLCVTTSTPGITLGANTGISVHLLCTSKTYKVADGLLRLLSAGWTFHVIPQVLKKLSSDGSGNPACWHSHFQYTLYWVQMAQTWIHSVSASFSQYTFLLVYELMLLQKTGHSWINMHFTDILTINLVALYKWKAKHNEFEDDDAAVWFL